MFTVALADLRIVLFSAASGNRLYTSFPGLAEEEVDNFFFSWQANFYLRRVLFDEFNSWYYKTMGQFLLETNYLSDVAQFLYGFFPGLHGQPISVTYPRRTAGESPAFSLGPRDPKRFDRDEIQRPRD